MVTIEGQNFATTTAVTVGGVPVANLEVQGPSTIVANVPGGSVGFADVAVTNGAGTTISPGGFAYVECAPAAGTALSFDGVNDYVEVGDTTPLGPHTLELWTRADISFGGNVIVGQLSGPAQCCGYGTMLAGTEVGYCYDLDPFGCSTNNYVCNTEDVHLEWVHLAGTWDGSTQRLYRNGELVAEDGSAGLTFGPSNWLAFGAIRFCTGYTSFFHGEIDEVRIWDHPRSPQQIRGFMHVPLQGDEPGLVGYWNMNEGAGPTAGDLSPSGYDGAVSGPTWVPSGAPICEPTLPMGTRYCTPASSNSTGQPGRLDISGSVLVADDDLTLTATQLPTGSNVAYFIMGTGMTASTPPGSIGPICVAPGIRRYLNPPNDTNELPGGFSRSVGTTGPVSSNITPGSTWNFQAWYRDSAAGTSNFTDAVSVDFE